MKQPFQFLYKTFRKGCLVPINDRSKDAKKLVVHKLTEKHNHDRNEVRCVVSQCGTNHAIMYFIAI